jgi:hypothetical protein
MTGSRRLSMALLVIMVVAGCTQQPATTTRDGRPVDNRSVDGPSGRAADARPLTAEEEKFLFLAEEKLVSRCMASKGFRYVPLAPGRDEPEARVFPYGNDDVAWARKYGYGIFDGAQDHSNDPVRNHPNQQIVDRLSPAEQRAYSEALTGSMQDRISVTLPDGHQVFTSNKGCTSSVRRQLYGELRRLLWVKYVTRSVEREVAKRVMADQQYLRALDSWRTCMRRRGYRYEDPGAARNAVELPEPGISNAARTTLRNREVQLAVADAECSRQAQIVSVVTKLSELYRARVTKDHEGDILAYKELRAAALQKARSLVASG